MEKRKNSYKLAVGLKYQPSVARDASEAIPSVEVKGDELMADEVVRIAKRFGVPVVEKAELARALGGIELDDTIPEELYEAVAILLNEIDKRSK